MLIRKDNIYREIEEHRLAEYAEKGFSLVEAEEKKKSLSQMNSEELNAYAKELDVEFPEGVKVAEKREIIKAFLDNGKE